MLRVRPVSSTKLSGHTALSRSSFRTTSPARWTRTSSVCRTLGARAIGLPFQLAACLLPRAGTGRTHSLPGPHASSGGSLMDGG